MSEQTNKTKRNIQPFNGQKYSIWKFRVHALIVEEDALQVIDKDIAQRITND